MADEIVVGAASVEVRAPQDKINDDFKKIKSLSQKNVQDIENNFGKIKMQMDDRLLKLKINDVQKLHAKLKQRLEEKIKLNYDVKSIETTRKQLESVKNALRDIKTESNNTSPTKGIGNLFGSAKGIPGLPIKGLGITGAAAGLGIIIADSTKAALEIEGVRNAFNKLNDPSLLDKLRDSVQGTVSDFTLMQSTVRADKFKVALEKLPVYFEFAKKRASETGQEVDYLVNSIIDGIGRKSTLVMDNLGISASELQNEVKLVGDFGIAAGNIIERELNKMGDVALTNKDKITQIKVAFENAEVVAGDFTIGAINGFLDLIEVAGKYSSVQATINSQYSDIADKELRRIEQIVKMYKGAVGEARSQALTEATSKNAAQLDAIIKDTESKINSLLKGFTTGELEGTGDLQNDLDQLSAKLLIYKNAHKELTTIFKPYESTLGQIGERIDLLKTKLESFKPGDLGLAQTRAEIERLENILNPKKSKGGEVDLSIPEIKLFNPEKEFQSLEEVEAEMFKLQDEFDEDFTIREIARTTKEIENDKRIAEEKIRQEYEIHNLRMNSISEFGNALEGLGAHGKTLVSYFNAALQATLRIVDAVGNMGTDKTSGILGIFSGLFGFATKLIPGLAQGGSVTNSGGNVSIQPYKKFASGTSGYMVPPGFNRDNYIIGVQSGERVDVTPANKVGNNNIAIERGLRDVYNRIGALTEVVRSSKANIQVINSSPDIESKVIEMKRKENRMSKRGMNFTDV